MPVAKEARALTAKEAQPGWGGQVPAAEGTQLTVETLQGGSPSADALIKELNFVSPDKGNLKPALVKIASKCVYPEGDIAKLGAPSVEGSVLGTIVKPIDGSEETRAEGICKSELEKPKVEDGENRKVAATEVGVEVGRIDSDGGKDNVKVEATTDASNSGEGSKSKSEVKVLNRGVRRGSLLLKLRKGGEKRLILEPGRKLLLLIDP
ncbi:hypothetical protein U1Q18_049031 [Sarracenia purpurea var. burkii]